MGKRRPTPEPGPVAVAESPEGPATEWMTRDALLTQVQAGSAPEAPCLRKSYLAEVSAPEPESRRVRFVISTGTVDRDNDTIDPNGWDLAAYRANPVVLWAHNYALLPLGHAVAIGVEGGRLTATAEFVPAEENPLAESVLRMIRRGALRATSVGFRPAPGGWVYNEARKGFDYQRQELLEFSVVPVPANPEALVLNSLDDAPVVAWAAEVLKAAGPEAIMGMDAGEIEVIRAVVETLDAKSVPGNPSGYGRADRDAAWSAPTLSDFTSDSWDDLSAAQRSRIARHFAWSRTMPPETFGDLKLPHHDPRSGSVVFRGVAAALGALSGARGGVAIPAADRAAVRSHLEAHYRQFGEEPPGESAETPEATKPAVEPVTTPAPSSWVQMGASWTRPLTLPEVASMGSSAPFHPSFFLPEVQTSSGSWTVTVSPAEPAPDAWRAEKAAAIAAVDKFDPACLPLQGSWEWLSTQLQTAVVQLGALGLPIRGPDGERPADRVMLAATWPDRALVVVVGMDRPWAEDPAFLVGWEAGDTGPRWTGPATAVEVHVTSTILPIMGAAGLLADRIKRGRVLAQRNEARLRQAVGLLTECLGELDAQLPEPEETQAVGVTTEKLAALTPKTNDRALVFEDGVDPDVVFSEELVRLTETPAPQADPRGLDSGELAELEEILARLVPDAIRRGLEREQAQRAGRIPD